MFMKLLMEKEGSGKDMQKLITYANVFLLALLFLLFTQNKK